MLVGCSSGGRKPLPYSRAERGKRKLAAISVPDAGGGGRESIGELRLPLARKRRRLVPPRPDIPPGFPVERDGIGQPLKPLAP